MVFLFDSDSFWFIVRVTVSVSTLKFVLPTRDPGDVPRWSNRTFDCGSNVEDSGCPFVFDGKTSSSSLLPHLCPLPLKGVESYVNQVLVDEVCWTYFKGVSAEVRWAVVGGTGRSTVFVFRWRESQNEFQKIHQTREKEYLLLLVVGSRFGVDCSGVDCFGTFPETSFRGVRPYGRYPSLRYRLLSS